MEKTLYKSKHGVMQFAVSLILVAMMPFCTQARESHLSLNQMRQLVLAEKFSEVLPEYAWMVQDQERSIGYHKGVDGDLLAEYAYVLALSGMYDGALLNLDRALSVGNYNAIDPVEAAGSKQLALSMKEGKRKQKELERVSTLNNSGLLEFYIAQVYTLMDYPNIANVFFNEQDSASMASVPQWIPKDYKRLAKKYTRQPVINQDSFVDAMKRANTFSVNKMYMQAIVLFQEMIDNYPKEYMPYMGQSKVWEKLGFYDKASELLTKGIALNPATENEKSPYLGHLQLLGTKSNEANLKPYANSLEQLGMFYIGGTFANSYKSLSIRYGSSSYRARYTESVSISLADCNGTLKLSVGGDFFKRNRFLVGGAGFYADLAKGSPSTTIKIMGGYSLLYADYSQSIDVMLSLGVTSPLNVGEGQKPSSIFAISVGKSLYFGKTKKHETL